MDEKEVIKVSIKETSPNVFRLTYNGRVLGDSRGYRKDVAINEALKLCDASYRCVVYILSETFPAGSFTDLRDWAGY